ncbi:MAG: MFS transporter [Alphaproteobacteria bacterium]|nr:MFS transporter [Alphaproteobacteria bacterium]MCY4319995.1 MFS transporter [Alphaproteobacteria bacterium]
MLNDPVKRNVLLLAICQALYVSGTALMISTAPLVGQMLAEDPGWATAPLFFHHGGVMTMTIPASLLMRRVGRRTGFMLGAVFGCIGALVAVEAIYNMSYWGFCLGAFLIGWFNGFAIFYRFAAADTATQEFRPKAISLVLAGGLLAAVIGPELGKHTLDWLEPVFYAGSYLSLVGLYVLSFCIVAFVRIPTLSAEERRETGRPLPEILRQPACVVAILAAAASYAAMSLVMSPTPLAMLGCGFTEFDALTVMQVHMVGMYLPAFFTGHLVSRFGARPIIFTGIALLAVCGAVNLSGIAFAHFAVALFLNGVGWNFMFVGGSSLLTEVHTAAERAKLQGINDFVVFGSIALSSLFSGRILEDFGWNWINIGILPMIAVPLLATLTLARPNCPRNN